MSLLAPARQCLIGRTAADARMTTRRNRRTLRAGRGATSGAVNGFG